jgi:hypothetical protein
MRAVMAILLLLMLTRGGAPSGDTTNIQSFDGIWDVDPVAGERTMHENPFFRRLILRAPHTVRADAGGFAHVLFTSMSGGSSDDCGIARDPPRPSRDRPRRFRDPRRTPR